MIALDITLVCLLAWIIGSLVNILTEEKQQVLEAVKESDRQRAVDALYGRRT